MIFPIESFVPLAANHVFTANQARETAPSENGVPSGFDTQARSEFLSCLPLTRKLLRKPSRLYLSPILPGLKSFCDKPLASEIEHRESNQTAMEISPRLSRVQSRFGLDFRRRTDAPKDAFVRSHVANPSEAMWRTR